MKIERVKTFILVLIHHRYIQRSKDAFMFKGGVHKQPSLKAPTPITSGFFFFTSAKLQNLSVNSTHTLDVLRFRRRDFTCSIQTNGNIRATLGLNRLETSCIKKKKKTTSEAQCWEHLSFSNEVSGKMNPTVFSIAHAVYLHYLSE